MKIYKSTRLTDSFKCPLYGMNNLLLSYRTCIDRQSVKTEYGKSAYKECYNCQYGKEIAKYFKTYQYTNKAVKIMDTKNKTNRRLRKGEGIFSPHYIGNPNIGKPEQTLDELNERIKR